MALFKRRTSSGPNLKEKVARFVDSARRQLDEADKLESPADRLLATLKTRKSLYDDLDATARTYGDKVSNLELTAYLSTTLGSLGSGLLLMSLVNPVAGGILMGVGIFTGMGLAASGFIRGHMQKKFLDQLEPSSAAFDEVLGRADKAIDGLLSTKTAEIAASDKFETIYDSFPEVRDRFIKTFNRAAAQNELASTIASAPALKDGKPGFAL